LQARRMSFSSAVKPPVAWLYLRCSPMMNSVSVLLSGISPSPLCRGRTRRGCVQLLQFCQREIRPAGKPGVVARERRMRVAQTVQQQVRAAEILPLAPRGRRDHRIQAGRLGRVEAIDRVLEGNAVARLQAQHAQRPGIDVGRRLFARHHVAAGQRLEPVPGVGAELRAISAETFAEVVVEAMPRRKPQRAPRL